MDESLDGVRRSSIGRQCKKKEHAFAKATIGTAIEQTTTRAAVTRHSSLNDQSAGLDD